MRKQWIPYLLTQLSADAPVSVFTAFGSPSRSHGLLMELLSPLEDQLIDSRRAPKRNDNRHFVTGAQHEGKVSRFCIRASCVRLAAFEVPAPVPDEAHHRVFRRQG